MEVEIFKAKQADLQKILQLQKNCYLTEAEIYNDFQIQPLMQDFNSLFKEYENSIILKAENNGNIVGSVRGHVDKKTVFIGKLIVDKVYQNKGIGRLLLEAIEKEFKDCERFELFTGQRSTKNLFLYNKVGYQEFNRERINKKLTLIYLEKKSQQPTRHVI